MLENVFLTVSKIKNNMGELSVNSGTKETDKKVNNIFKCYKII